MNNIKINMILPKFKNSPIQMVFKIWSRRAGDIKIITRTLPALLLF